LAGRALAAVVTVTTRRKIPGQGGRWASGGGAAASADQQHELPAHVTVLLTRCASATSASGKVCATGAALRELADWL